MPVNDRCTPQPQNLASRRTIHPIHDSLVAEVLNALLRQGEAFGSFTPGEHWRTDYAVWQRSVSKFRVHYGLAGCSVRDIDKYLWLLAQERRQSR